MQTITRQIRQRIDEAFRVREVTDDTLKEMCFEIAIEARALSLAPDKAGEKWRRPEIQMVKDVTGEKVDDVLMDWIIEKVAGHSKEEIKKCYFEWRRRNYRKGAYGWIDWLETGIPERENFNATKPNAGRSGARVHGPVRGGDQGKPAGGSVYSQLITDAAAD